MTADLDKILETLERQNEMIASLKAENDSLKKKIEEKELEPPPELERPEPLKEGLFRALENIPESERYATVAEFVKRFDLLVKKEGEKLLAEHKKECAKRFNKAKLELENLEKDRPSKLFQGKKHAEWQKKVDKARQDKRFAKSDYDFPPQHDIDKQAIENAFNHSKKPDFAKVEMQKARIFLRDNKPS